jgi:hypothetical protein
MPANGCRPATHSNSTTPDEEPVAGGLLRRHVRERPEHLAGQRHRCVVVALDPCEPEVQQDRPAFGIDLDVPGLDVAVQDAGFVCGMQRAGDALDQQQERRQLARRRRRARRRLVARARQARLQRLALDVAHRQERCLAVELRLQHAAQGWVVEPRDRLRLPLEAAQCCGGRRGAPAGQELERDESSHARVLREVDRSLAAAAELAQQPVVRDVGAVAVRGGGRRRRRLVVRGFMAAQELGRHLRLDAGKAREVVAQRQLASGALVGIELVEELDEVERRGRRVGRHGSAVDARSIAGAGRAEVRPGPQRPRILRLHVRFAPRRSKYGQALPEENDP